MDEQPHQVCAVPADHARQHAPGGIPHAAGPAGHDLPSSTCSTTDLSSVYLSTTPTWPGSLGTYSILWQIEQCRTLDLPWLYLSYWIADSRKMAYKANFRPLQMHVDGAWRETPP